MTNIKLPELATLPAVLTQQQAKALMIKNNVAEGQYKLVAALLTKTGQELQDGLHDPELAAAITAISDSTDAYIKHLEQLTKLAVIAQNRHTLMCRELLKIQQEQSVS